MKNLKAQILQSFYQEQDDFLAEIHLLDLVQDNISPVLFEDVPGRNSLQAFGRIHPAYHQGIGIMKTGRPKVYDDFKAHRREYMRDYRRKIRLEKRNASKIAEAVPPDGSDTARVNQETGTIAEEGSRVHDGSELQETPGESTQ